MIAINLFAAAVIAYRIRKGLFRRSERLLLALWFAHGMLVLAQSCCVARRFLVDWRYLDPANAILWLWAAWGVSVLWRRPLARRAIFAVLLGFAIVNGAMVIKHAFPVGRRARVVSVSREAACAIREDWKGPTRDPVEKYSPWDYHPTGRPVVEGPVSFRSAARLVGILSGGRSPKAHVFGKVDRPDYWLMDMGELPPEKAEKLKRIAFGKHAYDLYRRVQ